MQVAPETIRSLQYKILERDHRQFRTVVLDQGMTVSGAMRCAVAAFTHDAAAVIALARKE